MHLELEYNNALLESCAADEIKEEIIIGRSKKCDWRVSAEDSVISNRHARIFRKGKSLWIEDLKSTNGLYLKDKRITRKKLEIGDEYTFGDCTLAVLSPRGNSGGARSSVTVVSGLNKRRKHILEGPVFTIGAKTESDCFLPSELVSREHAEISVREDGSCWIEDQGSKNATLINGSSLAAGKERYLKDGDRIGIGQYELLFEDGALARESSQVWLKIGVLVVTFALLALGYHGVQRLRPSAEYQLNASRKLARQERFEEARQTLNRAETSRGFRQQELNVSLLRRSINEWEAAYSTWSRARENLQNADWVRASRDLAVLQAASMDAWNWNPGAAAEKDAAMQAKDLLDLLLRAQNTVRRDHTSMDELLAVQNQIDRHTKRVADADDMYLEPLVSALLETAQVLGSLLAQNERMNTALNLLDTDYPPYQEILTMLRNLRREASGTVLRRVDIVMPPIESLSYSFDRLLEAVNHTRNMDFAEALQMQLELPSVDACAVDPRISQSRVNLIYISENLNRTVQQLQGLHERLAPFMRGDDRHPEIMAILLDNRIMQAVLACDSINTAMPARSRTEPTSLYDRVLGVEEFYTSLRALPNRPEGMLLQQMPFVPVVRQFRTMCRDIELFMSFLDDPYNAWLQTGKLLAFRTQIEDYLRVRDALVEQHLAAAAREAAGRQALIHGGMAYLLAANPDELQLDGTDLTSWLVQRLRTLRNEMADLDREYSFASPQRQIALRTQILETGLPGDPVVRKMWTSRDASRQMREGL